MVKRGPRLDERKPPPEPVSTACSYTSDQLCYHAQISKLVLRAAVRAGLDYIKIGGARHFLGKDWLAWMEQHRGKSIRTTEGLGRPGYPGE